VIGDKDVGFVNESLVEEAVAEGDSTEVREGFNLNEVKWFLCRTIDGKGFEVKS
jgi:hypothetical protein